MSESQDNKYAGSLLGDSPLEKGRMKRWDYLIMAALTCVYAVVALTNLGSFDSPTSAWRNATARTAAVIDLGGEKEIAEFWHFDGIAKGEITLETSIDGENWEDAGKLELKDGEMYKWKKTSVEITARYLKLTPQGSNLWVNEMALWDKEGKLISPAQILSPDSTANSPLNLFDEQGFVPAHPTYMNEMYFDEIYHARTALEHIEGMPPYENTHPPLGKVFIAAGIKVFGMNPFGWRISGTLFGIFMVPLIYIFAKRLFKETKYAFLATALMSFDFMHFTQTRIATIDSYAVFFIIAMFYFMYRYYEMSFYKDKMWKTLAMLGLSGLMFGLGCATKWICIYAGAGLAVLFFIVLWRRWQEYRYALCCEDDAEGSAK
ncbi:MAG: phospholipid carrier-dependent glycosyltransferase, partial [Bacillota bacterium]|nr:phospholipid carrier-dependent glycosyltransferase [Bacillota bacterium]